MQKIYWIAGPMLALALGWFFRWDTVPVVNGEKFGGAYMINRWTGDIKVLYGTQVIEVSVQK